VADVADREILLTASQAAAAHGCSRTLAWRRARAALDRGDGAVRCVGPLLVADAAWWAQQLAPRGRGGRPRKYPPRYRPAPDAPVGTPLSSEGQRLPRRGPRKGA